MNILTNRYAVLFGLALALGGCEQYPPPGDLAIWENVNYAQAACGGGSQDAGCKYNSDEDGLNSIGKGKR